MELFKILKLEQNLRSNDNTYNSLLLTIGDGNISSLVIPNEWKTNDISWKFYGDVDQNCWMNRVILCPHNTDTAIINNRILKFLNGDVKTYFSIDYATHKEVDQTDDDIELNYPIEMLNNIKEGLPPHELNLKIDAIVMLIRNLSISDGLCNGTRLKIINLFEYNIEEEIVTGENIGRKVFIPRITLNTSETSFLSFTLYRKHFPIVLAFSMTINKSQGQSFDTVGLFMRRSLFSHGQLYVALSRCKNSNNIFIQNETEEKLFIKNIVCKEIFNDPQ